MAKKKEEVIKEHIVETPLEEIMGDRFGRYSKYIIQERALPDARDGLKPVQRRILYSMNEDGNTHDKKYRKSAKSVGAIMGNYHPHGDSSIYDAMVRLSQSWKSRVTLIDMQGNNGSIDDDPAAAMRYTEARLAPIAQMLLQDIEKNTVEFAPNFDDSEEEPTVLPARYPNLLVNGITGIASGYATNIPPHNLQEVLEATIYRVKNPNCSLDDLMEYVKGPDFPTGGIVQGLNGIKDAFTSGKGKVMVRSRVTFEKTKTIEQIIVHEIPYEVVKSSLVRKIDEVRLNKKVDGMLDVRDESDREGLRIAIDIKKGANKDLILNYLYKHTDLQVSYNYNTVAIVNKRPVQLGLSDMIDAFIEHRVDVITRRSRYDLDKKEKRCHVLEGLIKAISILDDIIRIIRSSQNKQNSKENIMKAHGFSDAQAEAIVVMQLYRLSSTDITALREEFSRLVSEMEELQDILDNPKMLRKVMVNELQEVNKAYGTPRLTQIEDEIQEIVINQEELIADEPIMISVSKDGYFKRASLRSFAATEGNGFKEGDEIIGSMEIRTLDTVLFFTNKGTYGFVKGYDLEEVKWKDVGNHISSIVKITPEEKIIGAFVLKDFATAGSILSITRYGMIKRTAIKDFVVSRNNKTMSAMKVDSQDEVVRVLLAYQDEHICVATKEGNVTRYPLHLVPITAPRSKGVKAMNTSGSEIVDMTLLKEGVTYLNVMSDTGALKRVKAEEINVYGRPTKGDLICKKVKSNPYAIRYIFAKDFNDTFTIQDEERHEIKVSDIPIMKKDSTFSTPYSFVSPWYYEAGITFIPQMEMTTADDEQEEYKELQLDL